MALPAGISTCLVTFGPVVGFDGDPASLEMVITPSTTLVWAGVTLAPFHIPVAPGAQGSVELPHVDQLGFTDASGASVTGWSYEAEGSWVHPDPDVPRISFRKRFQVLVGQDEVDLDSLGVGPVTAPVTAPLATVTSIGGYTGALTRDQARAALGIHAGDTAPEDPVVGDLWVGPVA